MEIMFVYVLLCVFLFTYWVFSKQNEGKLPPAFHGQLPVIGHAHLLLGSRKALWNLVENLGAYSVEKGGVTHIRLGQHLFYVISDPDDYVTVTNACLEKNFFYRKFLHSWVGDGLVTASVPTWRRISKLLSPAFSKHVFNEYIGIYNSQAKSLVDNMATHSGKEPFDPRDYLKQSSFKGTFLTTFGLSINEDTSRQMKKYFYAIDELMRLLTNRMKNVWMHSESFYAMTSAKKKEDELLQIINGLSLSIMAQKTEATKNSPKSNYNDQEQLKKSRGFLDIVLKLSNEGLLNDREIIDQVNTMTFAGYQTTAATLANMLVIIGSYPDVQTRIYEELQEVFEGSDRDADIEDLSKLVYLEAAIKEACRLYPVTPVIVRYVDKDVKLKNYTMKAGSNCVLLLHTLNRHKIWGADCEEFRPERWLEDELPPNPDIYTGFGAGRRSCIGRPFSIMSMKITLAHLLRRYKITADHTKLQMDLHIILEPTEGCHVSIESRH